jgi:predicted nucleotide-binding protein
MKPMAGRPLTALATTREAARDRLQQRIDLAKGIVPAPIRSVEDLNKAIEEEKKWRSYNVDLLLRMYTTDEYAHEYGESSIPVYLGEDRYFSHSLNTYASRLVTSLKRQVASLQSFIERLEVIDEAVLDRAGSSAPQDRSKVFVVHGHDEGAREGVARFLEKIGLTAIILAEQPNRGRTIIEKFVDCAREVGFAVVLLTPDDLGGTAADEAQKSRARQNVIFELGYFVGSLGRGRACLLRKGEVEIPSDLYGVVYTTMDSGNGWKIELARELKAAGFAFDADKVLA